MAFVGAAATDFGGLKKPVAHDAVSKSLNARMVEVASLGDEGVAAGDQDETKKLGIWASGFVGRARQGAIHDSPGYKSKLHGASVGMDKKFTERLIAGLAFTHGTVNIAHANGHDDDKTSANVLMLSAYGIYDFENNWYIRSVASIGRSSITNAEARPNDIDPATNKIKSSQAKSNYLSKNAGADVSGGYRYMLGKNTSITPSLGLSYRGFVDSGYSEQGAGSGNNKVSKKIYNQLASTIGASLTTKYAYENATITPELHAFACFALDGKNPKVVSERSGVIQTTQNRRTKRSYTVGGSAALKSGAIELSLGCDAQIAQRLFPTNCVNSFWVI